MQPGAAHAQNWLYTGTDYGTGANWSTGVTPGAGQTATFNGGGANQPIVAGNFTIGTVNMTAGSLTINNTRTLTLQSAYNLSGASLLGTGTLALGAGSLLTASGASTVAIAPRLSGAGAALITGSDVTFTGANTYTGTTTIDPGGVLQIGAGGTTGALGAGSVVDNGSLLFNRSNALTVGNAISGGGTVGKLGAGTTTLTGTNSYSGTTTITAGTLQIGAAGTAGTLGTGDVVNNGTLAFNRSDSLTVGNAISGSGGLTKTTAGTGTTVTLTGTNSYSGVTTISEGTLQVGAGGTAGTLGTGNVVNNGTLAFNRSDAVGYDGAISGTGAVNQIGAGTTTLTGASTYAGPTTISAGRLSINGSITGDVTVGAGGNLGGNGVITGSVTNNGIVAPGNSIGTLAVNGSFTQAAGGTYQVEVNAAGQSDRIAVTGAPGTATLNGGTVAVQAASGNYGKSTTYTILSASGGVSGTYSNVTSNFAFLTPSLSYDADDVFLTLLLAGNAFALGAQTPNQRAVGAVLDLSSGTATGDFATVLDALAGLGTAQGPAALDALSGQQYAGFGTANVASGLLFMNAVGQQMSAARGATGGGIRIALAQACDIACDGIEPRPWALWGSVLGGAGSVAGNGNASALTYNAAGFATGVDYRTDPRFLLGLGLGYVKGSQWVDGFTGQGATDSFQASAYASFTQAAFYLDALAGYGYNDNRLTRTIAIPGLAPRTATGRTGADQFLGQAEAGYRIGIYAPAAASLTPFARFQAAIVSQAAFGETGADSLDLSVAPQRTDAMRSTIGAELAGAIDTGWREKLALHLRLGWVHEYADLSRPVTASFAGAPGVSFTVVGAASQRDSALLGFAADTAIAEGTSLFVRYEGEFATGSDNHAVSAGVRILW